MPFLRDEKQEEKVLDRCGVSEFLIVPKRVNGFNLQEKDRKYLKQRKIVWYSK